MIINSKCHRKQKHEGNLPHATTEQKHINNIINNSGARYGLEDIEIKALQNLINNSISLREILYLEIGKTSVRFIIMSR